MAGRILPPPFKRYTFDEPRHDQTYEDIFQALVGPRTYGRAGQKPWQSDVTEDGARAMRTTQKDGRVVTPLAVEASGRLRLPMPPVRRAFEAGQPFASALEGDNSGINGATAALTGREIRALRALIAAHAVGGDPEKGT